MNEWDNDINNLFKRAAEEYPLKTGKGEWHKVEHKLSNKHTNALYEKKPNSFKKYSVLLAFLTIAFAGFIAWNQYYFDESTAKRALTQQTDAPKKIIKPQSTNHDSDTLNALSNKSVAIKNGKPSQHGASMDLEHTNSQYNRAINSSIKDDITINAISAHLDKIKTSPGDVADLLKLSNYSIDKDAAIEPIESLITPTNTLVSPDRLSLSNIDQIHQPLNIDIANNFSYSRKKSTVLKSSLTPIIENMYMGLTASAEFSSVKKSGFTNVGSSFSLIAGYQFSNKLSFETGVRRNNIFYKSNGAYYDRSNFNLTDKAKIVSLRAYNRITEVPFMIRYSVTKSEKNNFSFAAGTNITILHQQNYTYEIDRYREKVSIYREYDKAPAKILSHLLISAGYDREITNNTKLRVEPYYKLPLRPMGAGNLSVTGFGASIGLIRYLN